MKKVLIFTCLLISTIGFGQTNPEEEVLLSIVHNYLVQKGEAEFYIQCEKRRTFFEATDFSQNVNDNIPKNILEQLEIASQKDTISKKWEPHVFAKLQPPQDWLILRQCQTKQEIDNIFKKTEKRQNFYSLSQPIFDEEKEHCVIQVSVLWWPGSASGESLFMKKIYGKWVIVEQYDTWIT